MGRRAPACRVGWCCFLSWLWLVVIGRFDLEGLVWSNFYPEKIKMSSTRPIEVFFEKKVKYFSILFLVFLVISIYVFLGE